MRQGTKSTVAPTRKSSRPAARQAPAPEAADAPELDKIDRRILKLLQRNNQISNLELAEKTHLSPPTCLRRTRRLREEGIIVADVSLVDAVKVRRGLFVFIEVILERQTEDLQRAFEQSMRREDDIMQCYMIAGEIDYMVVAQVADIDAYHRFARRVLTQDPNIQKFRSRFAMNRSKFKTEISLSSD